MSEGIYDMLFPDYGLPKGPYEEHVWINESFASAQMPTCHLSIFFSTDKISYLLISPERRIIRAKTFESTGLLKEDLFLRFVLEKEETLRQTYYAVEIVMTQQPFTIIPGDYHIPQYYETLARLTIDQDLFEDETVHYPVNGPALRLLMQINPAIRHILNYYLKSYEWRHIGHLVLTRPQHFQSPGETFAQVLFVDDKMIVGLFVDGKLSLCNRYTCRSSTDVLYYLSAIRKVKGLGNKMVHVNCVSQNPYSASVDHWKSFGWSWKMPLIFQQEAEASGIPVHIMNWAKMVMFS